jgi:hypothetical protein
VSVDKLGSDMHANTIGPNPLPAAGRAEASGRAASRPAWDAVAVSHTAREHAHLRRLAVEYQAEAPARVAALRPRLVGAGPAADPDAIARAMLGLGI